MDENSAEVFYGQKLAGMLTKTAGGFEFAYDAAYLSDKESSPISLSMPLRSEKYESKELFPFFDGLLPEGWLLDMICSTVKLDPHDKFRLLLHTGGDPIGAVSVKATGESNG
ncbi:MAG TPA: HipA N-terminal domain-containing protein [Elusimicrobiota bacterium]|nr:HipA N-terminal domain-containing protein [Elusimicrobiota bacterium]